MVKRIRLRLSPATVITAIALFAVLGGGYATAFSGSGTVQKGALLNIPSTFTNVRNLTGIGSIQARCQDDITDVTSVQFNNTSGEPLTAASTVSSNVDTTNSRAFHVPVNSGSNNGGWGIQQLSEEEQIILHVSPTNGSKAPQADVQISANNTGNCATSYVTVLATNTQE